MKLKELHITTENQDEFKTLKKCGDLIIHEGAKFDAPALTTSGSIYIRTNAKFDAPALTTSGSIDISENAKFDAPALTTSDYIEISENAKFDAPALTTSGSIYIRKNAGIAPQGYVNLAQQIDQFPKFNPSTTRTVTGKDGLFYIYTSGTTGRVS